MNTIALDIVTPNGTVFHEKECEIVVVNSVQGELGIMAGHVPVVAALKIGVLRAKIKGETEMFAVTDGFVEIRPTKVTAFVQAAEFAEDIDTERAMEARERAEELLKKLQEDRVDDTEARTALLRATNRLNIAKRA